MANVKFSLSLNWINFCVIGLLVKVIAGTPADCEEVDLSSILKPTVFVTFSESLFFTVLANQKDWNISAIISDVNGVNCSLALWFQGGQRLERLQCPERKHEENVKISISIPLTTHVTLDVDNRQTCSYHYNSFTYCSRRIRITFPQMLFRETYKPKWFSTSLEAPMTMTVESVSNAKLTFNCKDIECLQTAGKLEGHRFNKRNAFFLKPADSFQAIKISLGDKISRINRTTLQAYDDSWLNVTLVMEASDVKVFVDGKNVMKLRYDIQEIVIDSVKMVGKGLLSWCDPRDRKKGSSLNMMNLILITITSSMVILNVMAGVFCCAKKCKKGSNSSDVSRATNANQGERQDSAIYEDIELRPHLTKMTDNVIENCIYGKPIHHSAYQ
ncbi:uncharacterized protein [Palaemon carinicauda]|uniref:uncharacterized protein n=1 Tax=Palaemon carinicauda TaxID=392227 RepID=UPI0035B643D9